MYTMRSALALVIDEGARNRLGQLGEFDGRELGRNVVVDFGVVRVAHEAALVAALHAIADLAQELDFLGRDLWA